MKIAELREAVLLKREIGNIFDETEIEILAAANVGREIEIPSESGHLALGILPDGGGLDVWQYLDDVYENGFSSDDVALAIERVRFERLRKVERSKGK